jgi:serine/threonine protein kinase
MGQVYLAASPGNRLVAIKVIHERFLADPELRARFRHEVQAARTVSAAFTAPIVDADPDAALPWLATSYIDAPTLGHLVSRGGPLPGDQALRLAAGLAEALKSVHAAGVIHRDLKPSNILIAADGPKVIDFGIARIADSERITAAGFIVGTAGYIAPEILRGLAPSPASDLFALGAVLYYAATAHHLYGAGDHRAVNQRVLAGAADLSAITHPALHALITHCLATDPDQRPSAAALLEQLSPTLSPTRRYPSAATRPVKSRSLRHPRRTALAAGCFLAAAGLLLAYIWPSAKSHDTGAEAGSGSSGSVFPWSVPAAESVFTGLWATPTEVVLGTNSGLTAYDPTNGTRLWTWSPPGHDVLCDMSRTASDGVGAVVYGTVSNAVYACSDLQAISLTTHKPVWPAAVSLAAPGGSGFPDQAGGNALSIDGGTVTAAYAGTADPQNGQASDTDLISVSAASGTVSWSTDFGQGAMPDGCTLTGLAQAFAGSIYTVGVCGGTTTLLSLGNSSSDVSDVGSLPACVLPTGGADVGFLAADSGYLLIDCAPDGSAQVLYVLAAGSDTPISLALTGADADFPGDAGGGQTWPGGFVMSDAALYLYTSQQLGISNSNGVIAVDMATGSRLWTHTFDQADAVTLLTADAAGVTVVRTTVTSAAMDTLSAQNGTPTDDYALTSAQAGLLTTAQWSDAPPFALQAGSQIALAFPGSQGTSAPLLGVLPARGR